MSGDHKPEGPEHVIYLDGNVEIEQLAGAIMHRYNLTRKP